jgi:hypothetical protein
MTEKLGYQLIEDLGGFEIRHYPPHILVSTSEAGSMATSGNQAFRRLANYIFGGNNAGKSIAMTAPVLQAQKEAGFVTLLRFRSPDWQVKPCLTPRQSG